MRERADEERIRSFLRELGRRSTGRGRVYLTGGATAVLSGWRLATVDIDLSFEPEDDRLLSSLPELKERFDVNVELVGAADFLPELPGWRDRSPFVARFGALDVHHLDPYTQALSKVERGFEQDWEDVQAMVAAGLVDPARALRLFASVEADLYRYPAVDPAALAARVRTAFGD